MGFILNVEGTTLGVETIKTVEFDVASPDDSNAKTTDVAVTATITGKILTMLDDGTEATVDLAKWSMISCEEATCYKNVVIQSTAAGQMVREYTMPNAFVVDYSETYDDIEGVGTFRLVITFSFLKHSLALFF